MKTANSSYKKFLQDLTSKIQKSQDKSIFKGEIFYLYELVKNEVVYLKQNNQFLEATTAYRSIYDVIAAVDGFVDFKDLILEVEKEINKLLYIYLDYYQFEAQIKRAMELINDSKYDDSVVALNEALLFYKNIQFIAEKNIFVADSNIQKIFVGFGDAFYVAAWHAQDIGLQDIYINEALKYYNLALGNHFLSNIDLALVEFFNDKIFRALRAQSSKNYELLTAWPTKLDDLVEETDEKEVTNNFDEGLLESNSLEVTQPGAGVIPFPTSSSCEGQKPLRPEDPSWIPLIKGMTSVRSGQLAMGNGIIQTEEKNDNNDSPVSVPMNVVKNEGGKSIALKLDGAEFVQGLFEILKPFREEIQEYRRARKKQGSLKNDDLGSIPMHSKEPTKSKTKNPSKAKKKQNSKQQEKTEKTLEDIAQDLYKEALTKFKKQYFVKALGDLESAESLSSDQSFQLLVKAQKEEVHLALIKKHLELEQKFLVLEDYNNVVIHLMEVDKYINLISDRGAQKSVFLYNLYKDTKDLLLKGSSIQYSAEQKLWLEKIKKGLINQKIKIVKSYFDINQSSRFLESLRETLLLNPTSSDQLKELFTLCIKSLAENSFTGKANEIYSIAMEFGDMFPKEQKLLKLYWESRNVNSNFESFDVNYNINQPKLFFCYAVVLIIEKLPYIENIFVKYTNYSPSLKKQNLLLKHSAILALNTIMQRNSIGEIFKFPKSQLDDKIFYSSVGSAVKYAYQDFKKISDLENGIKPINNMQDFINECAFPIIIEAATSSINILGATFNPYLSLGLIAISSVASGVNCYQMHASSKKQSTVYSIAINGLSIFSVASSVFGMCNFFARAQTDFNIKIMTLMKAVSYIPETYIIFNSLFNTVSETLNDFSSQEKQVTYLNGVIEDIIHDV